MQVASPGLNGQVPSTNVLGSIDTFQIVDYLVDVLGITLGASSGDLERPGSLLSRSKKDDTIQRCTRFAAESQVVLYVQKDSLAAEHANGVNGSSGRKCSRIHYQRLTKV